MQHAVLDIDEPGEDQLGEKLRAQALFDVPGTQGEVVYAECTHKGQHYRSMPFQLLDATGTKVTIYVFPRILFRFQLDSDVEDELLAVRGKFEVTNYSWTPYRAGPDGLVVVDYKTAASSSPADLDRGVDGYRLQGASYALAVTAATGSRFPG